MLGLRLDRRGFESWLKTRDENEIVGTTRACRTCPLAAWIRDTTGYKEAEVGLINVFLAPLLGETFRRMPEWARVFIGILDSSRGSAHVNVSAKDCLEVLAKVKEN